MHLNDSNSTMNGSYYIYNSNSTMNGSSYDFDFNSTRYEDYDAYSDEHGEKSLTPGAPALCTDAMCVFLSMLNVMIVLLGVTGNSFVIWIAGFKIKKTVNTVWYLSLAISDLLFCAFLPLSIVYVITQNWVFGVFMCKFASFVLFLNMLSSVFLLLVISVDRCVVVMFPVWAQNHRTTPRALVVVVIAWILSSILSLPAAIFRDVHKDGFTLKQTCFDNYAHDQKKHKAVVACRFLFGFLIPFVIIISCYVIISRKLTNNDMARSKKPFKVMTALIVMFFLSWMPYHVFKLLELNQSVFRTGQIVGSMIASANSFMNPLLYAFMGKDFKKKCYDILSKIESTFEEEARSTIQGTSVTNSGDGKLSSAV